MLVAGSSVSHAMIAELSVMDVTVGAETMTGGLVSGFGSVVKPPSPDIVGPFPAPSVEPTRKK